MNEQTPTLPNPLLSLHQQTAAEFQPYAQVEIVSTFGQPSGEYAALHTGVGIMDLPQRGLLELTGKDRLTFLNNLLSNKTWDKETKTGLKAGEGTYAFFLNGKGRIVTDMNVLELGERTLLEMDGRLVPQIRQVFEKYIFTEQVKLADRTSELHQIGLFGPKSVQVFQAAGINVSTLPPLGSLSVKVFGLDAVVWRDDVTGPPGFILICPIESTAKLWQQLSASDIRPVGWAAFNASRIEAGRPIFGIDFDDSVLPAETGQFNRAVSVTKGCYLGQEIVARMYARQQLARQLVGLRMENDALPMSGTKIFDDAENEIGVVTSSTLSPVLSNIAIALGYLKKPFFAVGTAVRIPAEGSLRRANVVELPFVRPEGTSQ